LFDNTEKSCREGFLFFLKSELRAVKWRDWKLHLYWEPVINEGPGKLESPYLFNLIRDPKEETNVAASATWVFTPMRHLIHKFNESARKFPHTPPGALDPS
jgi:arylsulfatase